MHFSFQRLMSVRLDKEMISGVSSPGEHRPRGTCGTKGQSGLSAFTSCITCSIHIKRSHQTQTIAVGCIVVCCPAMSVFFNCVTYRHVVALLQSTVLRE